MGLTCLAVLPMLCRLAGFLQFVTLLEFSIFWVAITDYLTFLFDCNWGQFNSKKGPVHHYFPDHSESTALPEAVTIVVYARGRRCCCAAQAASVTYSHSLTHAVPSAVFGTNILPHCGCCRLHGNATSGAHDFCRAGPGGFCLCNSLHGK